MSGFHPLQLVFSWSQDDLKIEGYSGSGASMPIHGHYLYSVNKIGLHLASKLICQTPQNTHCAIIAICILHRNLSITICTQIIIKH